MQLLHTGQLESNHEPHWESLGITLEDNILRKAEIVHCRVVSEATGQVLERNHVYGWSYDTILDTGIWQLIFHKIF